MNSIPVVGFSAWSGIGKTTLIEKLVAHLKLRGLRVAVIKHDAHEFQIDKEGKDSWRFAQAGADITLISSATKTALVEYRPRTFRENLSMIHDVDLILVEGYKQEDIPRIGICRAATGKGLPASPDAYAALVTDDPALAGQAGIPCFGLDDIEPLASFLLDLFPLT